MNWTEVQERLTALGVTAELREDEEDAGTYLSIPVGHLEAFEVGNPGLCVQDEVYVTFRRWDMTHALTDEVDVASVYHLAPTVVAHIVAGVVHEYEQQLVSMTGRGIPE